MRKIFKTAPHPLFIMLVFAAGYLVLSQVKAPNNQAQPAQANDTNGDAVVSTPVIGVDRIYYSDSAGTVYAADSRTGDIVWRRAAAQAAHGQQAREVTGVLGGGMFFYPASDGTIVAFDAQSGEPRWKQSVAVTGAEVTVGSLLCYDGMVYAPVMAATQAGSTVDDIVALDMKDGQVRWRIGSKTSPGTIRAIKSRLAVDPVTDSLIFMVSGTAVAAETLMAADSKTGELRWRQQPGTRAKT
jgi:outer membrane protein assembly factor BamB